jgi:hypothetical protein
MLVDADIASYCVGTRRKAMISHEQIQRCRKILEFDNVTNFQARMVAEINLYWCMHELSANADLSKVRSTLDTWMQEWKFLLGTQQFGLVHC